MPARSPTRGLFAKAAAAAACTRSASTARCTLQPLSSRGMLRLPFFPVRERNTKTREMAPLSGVRLLVVAGGSISAARARLFCQIAGGLGARVCESAAELEAGSIVVASERLPEARLTGLVGGVGAQTIVSESWLSSCAEEQARVCTEQHRRAGPSQPVCADSSTQTGSTPAAVSSLAESGGAQRARSHCASDEVQEPPSKRPKPAAAASRRKFVVVLAVREPERGSDFFNVKERLRGACEAAVHAKCAQLAGTLHFTLHTQLLSDEEAANVVFESPPRLPLRLKLASFQPWPSCLAVKIDASSTELVNAALQGIKGLRPPDNQDRVRVRQDQMHLSLYRARGMSAALKAQIPQVPPTSRPPLRSTMS